MYTFDLSWNDANAYNGGWQRGYSNRREDYDRYNSDNRYNSGRYPADRDNSERYSADRGAISDNDAINMCRDAVRSRVAQDGFRDVELRSVHVDDQQPWDGVVTGTARGFRGNGSGWYDFSCRVNMNRGLVRSTNVTRRGY